MIARAAAGGRVTVVGAGVAGLATALELARAGWRVELVGGGPEPSASSVAAGMLAPASEALLDAATPATTAALLAARDRWDAWARRLDLAPDASGALHLADDATLEARLQAARGLGLTAERRTGGLWLPQDALVQPATALQRMASAAADRGVVRRAGRVDVREAALWLDGAALDGEVVVAAGWGSAALATAAPELAALRPIKGQLLRIAGPPARGPVLRTPDAYLAPGPLGWTVGATMEPGRSDLAADAPALARLRAAAAAVRPELAAGEARAEVGVRAATDDGLPLVGRSCGGVWLATGLRRNGWLLAPLVAEGIAAYLAGSDAGAALAGQARAWDPARVLPRPDGR